MISTGATPTARRSVRRRPPATRAVPGRIRRIRGRGSESSESNRNRNRNRSEAAGAGAAARRARGQRRRRRRRQPERRPVVGSGPTATGRRAAPRGSSGSRTQSRSAVRSAGRPDRRGRPEDRSRRRPPCRPGAAAVDRQAEGAEEAAAVRGQPATGRRSSVSRRAWSSAWWWAWSLVAGRSAAGRRAGAGGDHRRAVAVAVAVRPRTRSSGRSGPARATSGSIPGCTTWSTGSAPPWAFPGRPSAWWTARCPTPWPSGRDPARPRWW